MADRTPSGCRRKHPGPVVRPVADSRNVHFFFQNCPAEKTRGGRRAGMKAALLAVAIGAQVSAGFVPAPARCGLLVVAPRADAACIPGRARALDDRVGARRSAAADRFRHALHMSGTSKFRTQFLWRGMRDRTVDDAFLLEGGAEMACMSTSDSIAVVASYSQSRTPLLFRIKAGEPAP